MANSTKIELQNITRSNIQQLRNLNLELLPLEYSDRFYLNLLEANDRRLSKLLYYNGALVAAICTHIENTKSMRRLYIDTLGCIQQHRRLGLGTILMNYILKLVQNDGNLNLVYLHVQINNEPAIKFYSRFGFKVVKKVNNKYPELDVKAAYELIKMFGRSSKITNAGKTKK